MVVAAVRNHQHPRLGKPASDTDTKCGIAHIRRYLAKCAAEAGYEIEEAGGVYTVVDPISGKRRERLSRRQALWFLKVVPAKVWQTLRARAALAGYAVDLVEGSAAVPRIVVSRQGEFREFSDLMQLDAWLARVAAPQSNAVLPEAYT
jgi:hypothetical protein